MDYISVKEASVLWGIDPSNIGKLCRKGKIEGAKIVGRNWLIPKNAEKPLDGRTKTAKENQSASVFRFPLYVNFPEESFAPPLSKEEAKLRQAQLDFFALEFQKSKTVFEDLSENAENIYVKFSAQFFMCALSALYDVNINWGKYYYSLNFIPSADFPHKKEMELFLPWLDFVTGQVGRIPEKLNTDSAYEYHPSAWYMNAFLSVFNFDWKNELALNPECIEPYGTICRIMERDGYLVEAQQLHMILFLFYYRSHREESMFYHLRRAVRIAYEHNILTVLADADVYYSDPISAVLSEYPDSFAEKIHRNGKAIYANFSRFAEKIEKTHVYTKLSRSDYRFVFYAIEGFTNKQIADILGLSERTVSKKYNDIYGKIGVFGKQELLNEIYTAFGKKP